MITEIFLLTNSVPITTAFWSAVFNAPAVDLGDGRWSITAVGGPTVQIAVAPTLAHVTCVDLTVSCDVGAPERLRAAGFEVAVDGMSAVDVNGCDNTVRLLTLRSWDGVSEIDWEEPDPDRIAAITARPPDAVTGSVVRIRTYDVHRVARFLVSWFDMTGTSSGGGAVRFEVGRILWRVEQESGAGRQWVPLGSREYAAAVERCIAAGFDVVSSATDPDTAAHCDVGNVTFLLSEVDR
ncbi:Uncharacterised protein [Mycobacteroides abscessus subsp. abscessus]|uniref:hypothetical protein n=1 Tax=Mycobacteroides abscessus TaxID=36809 RepID=UPI0009C65694|nr:hypothetical protein [Mycobacteroides abscessus]SKM39585.1 Uncharacterised protein [Mycobacteroides abscessus subsp. abscessus]